MSINIKSNNPDEIVKQLNKIVEGIGSTPMAESDFQRTVLHLLRWLILNTGEK